MTQLTLEMPDEVLASLHKDPAEFTRALQTRINVAYEFYVTLRVVK